MRWFWSRAERELNGLKQEIEQDRRDIEAAKPVLEEETTKTDRHFEVVEAQTRIAQREISLFKSLRSLFDGQLFEDNFARLAKDVAQKDGKNGDQ